MAEMLRPILASCILISLLLSSSAQKCADYEFANNRVFTACNDLPHLNSFLHWTYNPSSGKLQVAYRHTGIKSSRWVAWAINPSSEGMVGAQALVAFKQSNGTMRAYTSALTSYQTRLQEAKLDFDVTDLSAVHWNSEIIIFATLKLPNNSNNVHQVWQEGPLSGDTPAMHDTGGPNVLSMGTMDLLSGEFGTAGWNLNGKKKELHGMINAVSWGIVMPIGAIVARYLRKVEAAKPAWLYVHLGFQTLGYIAGTAGWATGIALGNASPGVVYGLHRGMGFILFLFASLQVVALVVRPSEEHKYRPKWNIYHHSVGYSVVVISVANIFKGLAILKPKDKWQRAYVTVLVLLSLTVALLEAGTRYFNWQRKKMEKSEKKPHGHGANVPNTTAGFKASDAAVTKPGAI